MLTVLTCIERDHDPWLVLMAGLVCLIGCHATVRIIIRARDAAGRPDAGLAARAWAFGAAIAFGSVVWSTHFVAMLSYSPGLGANLNFALTALSLAVAVGGSMLAIGGMLWRAASPGRVVFAGSLLGATTFAMHCIGIRALNVNALVEYDLWLLAAALVLGSVAATGALAVIASHPRWSGALLAGAICGLHFTAMSALTVTPFGAPTAAVGSSALAVAVAAVCLLILLPGLAGAILDQQLARRAEREAARLRQFTDSTFEGILFHRGGVVTDINKAFCELTGSSATGLLGRPVAGLFAPASRYRIGSALLVDSPVAIEVALLGADGREISVEVLGRPIDAAPSGQAAAPSGVMVVRDLTYRKDAERRIERLAHYDTLTGAANRTLLHERLAAALDLAGRVGGGLALLWIDLDRFKSFNDLLGYRIGDRLLALVAGRLARSIGASDTIARVGGGEFAVVQPAARRQDAQALAERLLAVCAEPFDVDGHCIDLGCSIGISLYPDDSDTAETLIGNAALALVRAKQHGRDRSCFFDGEMDCLPQERLSLEQELRAAHANGGLSVYYQPQFAADDLRLLGYEALMRWHHPQRGVISPVDFIPMAKSCGLIVALGHWVLETACAEAASWDEPHLIAVNLSPVQLRKDDLAPTIGAILRRTGLDPWRLELEITEGVLITDPDHAMAVLRAIKLQGIRIALDDYGTGYSSLNYLSRFAFDKIKIDASYVRDLGREPTAEVILASMVALGHGLDMKVTAEGVETDAQLTILRDHGCDHIQGYLLGRPTPRHQIHHCAHRAAEPLLRLASAS